MTDYQRIGLRAQAIFALFDRIASYLPPKPVVLISSFWVAFALILELGVNVKGNDLFPVLLFGFILCFIQIILSIVFYKKRYKLLSRRDNTVLTDCWRFLSVFGLVVSDFFFAALVVQFTSMAEAKDCGCCMKSLSDLYVSTWWSFVFGAFTILGMWLRSVVYVRNEPVPEVVMVARRLQSTLIEDACNERLKAHPLEDAKKKKSQEEEQAKPVQDAKKNNSNEEEKAKLQEQGSLQANPVQNTIEQERERREQATKNAHDKLALVVDKIVSSVTVELEQIYKQNDVIVSTKP